MCRERILNLHHDGLTQKNIADTVRVSVGYVNKVIQYYETSKTSLPQLRKLLSCDVVTEDVMEYTKSEKLCKPSIYTSEIKQRLLLDGVSPIYQLPSQSAIKKCLKKDCKMTNKKTSKVLAESLSHVNVEYRDYFLDQIEQIDCTKTNFFD